MQTAGGLTDDLADHEEETEAGRHQELVHRLLPLPLVIDRPLVGGVVAMIRLLACSRKWTQTEL